MGSRVVLVVEDNPDHALLVRIALDRVDPDLEVHLVEDGRDAIRYLAGEPPYSDRAADPLPGLLILDLMLPEVSGFEVLEWLRADPARPKVPVVVLTSSVNPGDMVRAMELGARGFHTKPADLHVLGDLMRRIVHTHLDPGAGG